MEEPIQDVLRTGCKNREKLHSIISKISENATTEESAMNEDSDDHGYEVVLPEHGYKRKLDIKCDTSRKLLKPSSVQESEEYIRGEGIDTDSVTIFPDLHHGGPFSLGGESVHTTLNDTPLHSSVIDHSPMYPQDTIRASNHDRQDRHSPQDDDDDDDDDDMSDEELNLTQQVALGLIPNKNRRQPSPCPTQLTQVPFEFQKKLEELEKEVRDLQNRNRALEESYKKLTDLVEAQNHLLSSGAPLLQHIHAQSAIQSTREELVRTPEPQTTDHKVIATSSIPSYVTSATVTQMAQPLNTSPLNSKSISKASYELPRRVSAKEVLSLWEHGCEEFPPLKDWTPTQKLKQQSKISRWKKLVDIFKNDYEGDLDAFAQNFSDPKGELLPVTTILSLYETKHTPAFLNTSSSHGGNENGTSSPVRRKSEDEERGSRGRLHSDVESELSEEHEVSETQKEKTDTGEVRYALPRKVTPRDIVHLWDHGCEQFPPVGSWSRAQKIGQETKLFRWKKIVDIFNTDCKRRWDLFDGRYSNEKGLLAISAIIAKYDAEYAVHGPIFDKPEPRRHPSVCESDSISSTCHEVEGETVIMRERNTIEPLEVKIEIPHLRGNDDVFALTANESAFDSPDSLGRRSSSNNNEDIHEPCIVPNKDGRYILPRKVTAKDVIRMWEEGFQGMPPLSQWSPAQKAGQRSKFSRWAKVYDIFKYHCKGSMHVFERLFSDERGELYPITTIVAMYDARDTATAGPPLNGSGLLSTNGGSSESEVYQLPRKVSAKDVVRLWEEGCEAFPPICKWPKIHRVGHETKLFRWKKVVDIFRKDCDSSWEVFESRFSNLKGELLPISAILAKYDLENEPISYYKPLTYNGTVTNKELNAHQITESAELPEGEARSPNKPTEFILPKKVSALDVIYLWENGMGDMPPVCQWSTSQRAGQRSKISRWNKIVDIFKYECGSDIRQFEEKYKDERGELMPITTILNLHDAQDKPWE
ncbi:predicted protein [Nematostella vectensis]|uniref:Uncharacterized protein n=1 Tax=Nematostella vectensis TaxID=45351 RepID=A7RGU0_NEMVE|nr:predicted protein [Nematostella vectensis]|eukprot:XP_001641292.1 predicted protein [Nematostella vectensis]